ncbi:MAG: hypothetical protein PGN16_19920, partial [Sphingomonas phyllosphaerae]|uniref:hypothetical protein n=1 Tax=Sphingomonas phyllosphaerae TaxID=257003 RepID=UPI002FF501DA
LVEVVGYNRASADIIDRFALHDKTGVEMGPGAALTRKGASDPAPRRCPSRQSSGSPEIVMRCISRR